jgi:hypothetical protein
LLPSLEKKTVLVEGTAHTMYTTQIRLAFEDIVHETGPVELREGHWLTSMLTCHKQNSLR